MHLTFFRYLFPSTFTMGSCTDRLNNFWTPVLLIILSIIASVWQLYSDPICCWTPAMFPAQWVIYVSRECWWANHINRTYIHNLTDPDHWYLAEGLDLPIVSRNGMSKDDRRTLYQVVPLLLALQALLFKIPDLISHIGQSKLGMGWKSILRSTEGYEKLSIAERSLFGKQLAGHIKQWTESRPLRGCPLGLLTIFYAFIKMLYVINISVQLGILDRTLKPENTTSFGAHVLHNIFNENASLRLEVPLLPRQVECHFQIKQIQNLQKYLVPCIIPINELYEQMFGLLWLWFFGVSFLTICSGIYLLARLIIPFFRVRYLKKYLLQDQVSEANISRFASHVIGEDGVMVLKWISKVSSELLVREVVVNLWEMQFPGRNMIADIRSAQTGHAWVPGESTIRETAPSAPTDSAADSEAHCAEKVPMHVISNKPPSYQKLE